MEAHSKQTVNISQGEKLNACLMRSGSFCETTIQKFRLMPQSLIRAKADVGEYRGAVAHRPEDPLLPV